MSGASEIVLWLEEEKLSALRERNISVEAELQAALETLYCQSVPQTVREEIQSGWTRNPRGRRRSRKRKRCGQSTMS